MSTEFSRERSDAIRSLLVTTAAPSRRAPSVLVSIGLVVLGLTVGAAVSAAAMNLTTTEQPTSTDGSGVPAPPGIAPGQPIVSLLGAPTTQTVLGDADIELASLPEGATHARVSITCLTTGLTSWGFDASGNNPSIGCSIANLGNATAAAYYDFPLDDDSRTLYIRADDDAETVISYQFLNYVETAWGINANGESFGVSKEGIGDPDLVAVSALSPSGENLGAYSRKSDLDAFGPDWPELPSNPTEAIEWQAERDQKYPDGWDIPAYKSDGLTQVGVFHIGGGH